MGDGIRTDAESLVTGLQAHASFHFTFALVEMPVYARSLSDANQEFVVIPHTLIKTVTVPRLTISTTDGAMIVRDAGIDEAEAKKPSRRSNISSEAFFEAMEARSPDLPGKLKQFLDDIDGIGVRAEFLASLNLKWDRPQGRPVNLGYIRPSGEVRTEASYWWVDPDLAEDYNLGLASLFGGEVTIGRRKKDGSCDRWVTRTDGNAFYIEEVADLFSDWRSLMENFQDAIQARARERET